MTSADLCATSARNGAKATSARCVPLQGDSAEASSTRRSDKRTTSARNADPSLPSPLALPPGWMAEDDRRRAATMAAGRERRMADRERSPR